MELEELHSSLAQWQIKRISYVGGEPLLFPSIMDILSHAHQKGLITAIVSNGTLLNENTLPQLTASGISTIMVSLDGPQEIHDLARGKKGTFQLVYRNIKNLQRYKKINKLKKPRVIIYTTLSTLNINHISEILEIASQLDVNAIRFQTASVVSEALSSETANLFAENVVGLHSYSVDTSLKLSEAKLAALKKFIAGPALKWARKAGIELQAEQILLENPETQCEFIKKSFLINPNGELLPCPMMPKFSLGNLRKHSLDELWGNRKHQQFLSIFKKKGYFPICSQCCVEPIPTH